MTAEAWNKMEEQATAMTNARELQRLAKLAKLEEIRKFNREHSITSAAVDLPPVETEAPSAFTPNTNAAAYVLSYLFPEPRKKKK